MGGIGHSLRRVLADAIPVNVSMTTVVTLKAIQLRDAPRPHFRPLSTMLYAVRPALSLVTAGAKRSSSRTTNGKGSHRCHRSAAF